MERSKNFVPTLYIFRWLIFAINNLWREHDKSRKATKQRHGRDLDYQLDVSITTSLTNLPLYVHVLFGIVEICALIIQCFPSPPTTTTWFLPFQFNFIYFCVHCQEICFIDSKEKSNSYSLYARFSCLRSRACCRKINFPRFNPLGTFIFSLFKGENKKHKIK